MKIKYVTQLCLITIAMITAFALSAATGYADNYDIDNWTQLQNIPDGTASSGNTYVLTGNLTSASPGYTTNFYPIGLNSGFSGTFDGHGNTISGLTIDATSSGAWATGLFGWTSNATIQNVTLSNVNITGSGWATGALIGYNESAAISNVNVSGSVKDAGGSSVGGLVGDNAADTGSVSIANVHSSASISGSTRVGGLVGSNYNSSITIANSSSSGNVTGDNYTGGLVGEDDGSTITKSSSSGNVTGNNYTGGLVGMGASGATITESYSTSNVTGAGNYTGGLAGLSASSTITNSNATGNVSGGGDYTGGMVGLLGDLATVTNSYSSGVVTGSSDYVGGLSGLSASNWGVPDNQLDPIVTNSYSIGTVTGNGDNVGSLVGMGNPSDVINSGAWTGAAALPIGSGGNISYNAGSPSAFYASTYGVYDPNNVGGNKWDFTNTWFARPDNTPVLTWVMQGWIRAGGTSLGLSLSDQDIAKLMSAYGSEGSTSLGGYTWAYIPGTLPGDDGTKNYGDIWTFGGHTYLKLGSGDQIDPMNGGNVPEPSTVVVALGALIVIGIRRFRRG